VTYLAFGTFVSTKTCPACGGLGMVTLPRAPLVLAPHVLDTITELDLIDGGWTTRCTACGDLLDDPVDASRYSTLCAGCRAEEAFRDGDHDAYDRRGDR
jgi:hypothetical protein